MSEMPERIWAGVYEDMDCDPRNVPYWIGGQWESPLKQSDAEYIRADLYAQLAAELDTTRKALEQALSVIYRHDECFHYDVTNDVYVCGFEWEDGAEQTWNMENPELATYLKAKENQL